MGPGSNNRVREVTPRVSSDSQSAIAKVEAGTAVQQSITENGASSEEFQKSPEGQLIGVLRQIGVTDLIKKDLGEELDDMHPDEIDIVLSELQEVAGFIDQLDSGVDLPEADIQSLAELARGSPHVVESLKEEVRRRVHGED